MKKIHNDTEIYEGEISKNFISQINTHYSNVQSDLLMVAKHGYPMYLTQNDLKDRKYFYYNKNSAMFEELKKLNPLDAESISRNLMKDLVKKFKNDTKDKEFDESVFMEEMLNKEELNKISGKKDVAINEDMKIYLNYLIPIMKSILIRNAIYEREKNTYLRFKIFLEDNDITYKFEYPNNQQGDANFDDPKFSQIQPDKIIFDDLKFDNYSEAKQLISRGCLNLDFGKTKKNSFICLEFTFNNFLEGLRHPLYKKNKNNLEYIAMFLFNKNKEEKLKLYFSSMKNESLTKETDLIDELLQEVQREMDEKKKIGF